MWIADTTETVLWGGRYQGPKLRGTACVYSVQQFIFGFHTGDKIIGLRFHPNKADKYYAFYDILEPFAYKI